MRKLATLIILLAATILSCIHPSSACTDFQVKTTAGSIIVGRSMEWGSDLCSRLIVHSQHENHTSTAPGGKIGLKWSSKYGYIGTDANKIDTTLDGLNENGLSYGALWLPEYTKYQDISSEQTNIAINFIDLGDWILGNFQTVDEVKTALKDIRIWANIVPSFGGIPTAHIALHDSQGKNLVIEFINGEQKIYENPIGVMTNAPPFDWHLINLSNYIMVDANNRGPIKVAGTILCPPGQGNGFFGIPGDWTPPSRFIRTAAMLTFAKKVSTPTEGVNLAEHILNAVDIPKGNIREKTNDVEYTDYTQWIVIKDLTNKVLYFRSYDNLTLRALDLKKIDFGTKNQSHYFVIDDGNPVQEISTKLK